MNPFRPQNPTRVRKARRRSSQRRGTEVVELALVLPLLLLLVFSTLELCEKTFLLQKIKIAAHEGAVVAIRRSATVSDVEDAVQDYLEARGVDFGSDISSAVSITPDPAVADKLTPITVTVTVDTNDNSRVGAHFYRYFVGDDTTGNVTMFKEFKSN